MINLPSSYNKMERGNCSTSKNLCKVKIQRDIFQEDALFTLLFVIGMILLNYIPRKSTGGYKFLSCNKTLITVNDIQLFAKKWVTCRQLNSRERPSANAREKNSEEVFYDDYFAQSAGAGEYTDCTSAEG